MKTNKQELILGILICLEIVLFAVNGQNFFSLNNFFECIRLAVEIGLLALALTPVIVIETLLVIIAPNLSWGWLGFFLAMIYLVFGIRANKELIS